MLFPGDKIQPKLPEIAIMDTYLREKPILVVSGQFVEQRENSIIIQAWIEQEGQIVFPDQYQEEQCKLVFSGICNGDVLVLGGTRWRIMGMRYNEITEWDLVLNNNRLVTIQGQERLI